MYAIDNRFNEESVRMKIREQKEQLGHSKVDYKDARELKESSDEKRLQPIYIRLFFEKAFNALGGNYTEIRKSIFRIHELPHEVAAQLREDYRYAADIQQILFCFDKQVFLEYQDSADLGKVHYITPGNPVFDSMVKVICLGYKEDMLQGTILVSPEDKEDYFAFYIKSQVTDNRPTREQDSIADEKLRMVMGKSGMQFKDTSPAKFIDLHAPTAFAKTIQPPGVMNNVNVIEWSFQEITQPQFEDTKKRVETDTLKRKKYLEEAFKNAIFDLTAEINELQGKLLHGNRKVQEKIDKKQERINALKKKKTMRLEKLQRMLELNMKPPEVLGCAYVMPLTHMEYETHFGMSRDDECEAIAMETAMDYERRQGWEPEDVSEENAGYDIRSTSPEELKRYIEVKGRCGIGSVMLSENEMHRLDQLADSAWLYIVINCKTKPELFRFQDPAQTLRFELIDKGIQFLLPLEEWKGKIKQ
jgi:hypothetical protein